MYHIIYILITAYEYIIVKAYASSCITIIMHYHHHVLPPSCITIIMHYHHHVLPSSCITTIMYYHHHALPSYHEQTQPNTSLSCFFSFLFFSSHSTTTSTTVHCITMSE